MRDIRDRTPTERIGFTAYRLTLGGSTTSRQLAGDLEITEHGARKMLEKLSRVMPLVVEDGIWRLMQQGDRCEG